MEQEVAQLPVHDRLLAWFEVNRKAVTWTAGSLLVVGMIVGFVLWRQAERQNDANAALAQLLTREVPDPDRTVTAASFLKLAGQYPDSAAGGRALLLAGEEYFLMGKYAESKAQFDRFLREYRDSPFAIQAQLGSAVCLEVQGQTNQAINAYMDIVQHHAGEPIMPVAKFALARLYEEQGKYDLARDQYQDLARPGAFNSISTAAGMRLEELLIQHPELAKSVVPTAAAPVMSAPKP